MMNEPELNRQRRNLLVAAAATLGGLYTTACGGSSQGAVQTAPKSMSIANVRDFQTQDGGDWTSAANAAMAAANRVYFPAGTYVIQAAGWPANTEIFGDGDDTILIMPAGADYLFTCDSGSPRPERNVANLYMHDLQLRGTSDIDGFAEHKHLVSLNGVSSARFRNVLFKGFRGDALYFGSGNVAGSERHNVDVIIENCRFDGINNANRNAITVIDGDGILVTECSFENTTAPNMPGAIDVEPNRFPFHIARNIRVLNNRFNRIGGFTGIIAVSVPAEVSATPANITVEGNISTGYTGRGGLFFFNAHRVAGSESAANNITVRGNTMRGGGKPFLLTGKGITVRDNVFQDLPLSGALGFTKDVDTVRDVQLVNNVFERCGSVEGYGVSVFTADNVRFAGNTFADCGAGVLPTASAVVFRRGRSSNVTFEENRFTSPTGKMLAAILRDAGHDLQAPTNRFTGNQVNGLTVHFQTGPT